MTVTGRDRRSTVTDDGTLRLTLEDVTLEPPSADGDREGGSLSVPKTQIWTYW